MNRFVLGAALAAVIGLGTANTADAQYVQRYTTITPNGGVMTQTGVYTLGAYQTYNGYISPYGNVRERVYYGDVYGNSVGRAAGYNTWNGLGYNRGFYQPSPLIAPYGGGYNYNFYGRRW